MNFAQALKYRNVPNKTPEQQKFYQTWLYSTPQDESAAVMLLRQEKGLEKVRQQREAAKVAQTKSKPVEESKQPAPEVKSQATASKASGETLQKEESKLEASTEEKKEASTDANNEEWSTGTKVTVGVLSTLGAAIVAGGSYLFFNSTKPIESSEPTNATTQEQGGPKDELIGELEEHFEQPNNGLNQG